MTVGRDEHDPLGAPWQCPLDLAHYDRTSSLSSAERAALSLFTRPWRQHPTYVLGIVEGSGALDRLLRPLQDVFAVMEGRPERKINSIFLLLRTCGRENLAFWGWKHANWVRVLGTTRTGFFLAHQPGNATDLRQYLRATAL